MTEELSELIGTERQQFHNMRGLWGTVKLLVGVETEEAHTTVQIAIMGCLGI